MGATLIFSISYHFNPSLSNLSFDSSHRSYKACLSRPVLPSPPSLRNSTQSSAPLTRNIKVSFKKKKEELKRLEHEYKSNCKVLEAERRKVELAAEQRREEERMRQERIRKLEKKANSVPGLVKMVGKAVCTRCKDKKIDCYRAPRQHYQPTVFNIPGVLKDFIQCQSCADTKLKCRTAISPTTAPARNTATQSKPRMSIISITTATSPAPTPGRPASGAAAGTKRKRIIAIASDEDEAHSDSDSGPAPSSSRSTQVSKRFKSDVVPEPSPRPRSHTTGQFLSTIRKPAASKYASQPTSKPHSHSSHPHSNSSLPSSPSQLSSDPSSTASASVASEETLKSILDNMNRNHNATMKLFTRLLRPSAHAPPSTSTPAQGVNETSSSTPTTISQSERRERGLRGSGSGSGSRQSQRVTDSTRERGSKSMKRKVLVKLEDDEFEQHDGIAQLASDYENEVIVIEDDDDD
ncbi:hypothetical protein EST38_g1536 [Candolleomyces aberdarensis]|uniref:Uncharacterized protein n=1 Tax=Candolleomyces aberdarensis TaxID=2316362 RepID=A0A4Q2DXV1_9AGAR|nr:hypothetical protein EST38_g1536 [Candolleomyces aberdarensis]